MVKYKKHNYNQNLRFTNQIRKTFPGTAIPNISEILNTQQNVNEIYNNTYISELNNKEDVLANMFSNINDTWTHKFFPNDNTGTYLLDYTKPSPIYPNSIGTPQILSHTYLRHPMATNPDIDSNNNKISTTQFVNQTLNKPLNYINIDVPIYIIEIDSKYLVGLNYIVNCASKIYLPTNCPLGTEIIIINDLPITDSTDSVDIYVTGNDIIVNTVSQATDPILGSNTLNIPSSNICNFVYIKQQNIWRSILY
jgi:hypothetical protein